MRRITCGAPANNGMHPTANSVAFILNLSARRVMPSLGRLQVNMFTSLVLTFWLLGTPPSVDCRRIEDSDRRSFDKRGPITLDVDGDGKLDTIIPRIYKVRRTHWISFDLKTSRGRILKSFFKYEYGTDESAYWVYALVPCKTKYGRTDLVFYSGDDTTSETVNLVKRGSAFKVHSRKVTKVE